MRVVAGTSQHVPWLQARGTSGDPAAHRHCPWYGKVLAHRLCHRGTHDPQAGISHKGQQAQSPGLSHPALFSPHTPAGHPLSPGHSHHKPTPAPCNSRTWDELCHQALPHHQQNSQELSPCATSCSAAPGEAALGGRAPSGSPAPAGELGISGLGPWHRCGCPAQGAKAWSWGTGCCYSLPWRERLQALCASGGHDPSKGPHKTAAGLPPRNRLHSAGPRHLPGQLQVRTASACVPGPPVRHSCPRWAPHPGAGPASMPAPSSRQDGQAARSALRPHHSPPLRYLPRSPPLAQPRPRLPTRGPASAYL